MNTTRMLIWAAVCLVQALFAAAVFSQQEQLGLTLGKDVALYAQPREGAEVVVRLEKSQKFTPLGGTAGTKNPWYLVRTEQGIHGWVRSSQVEGRDRLEQALERSSLRGPSAHSFPRLIRESNHRSTSVPVRLNGSAIFVPVYLNGVKRTQMMMDTGASFTVVSPQLAKGLGLRRLGSKVQLMTANGRISAPLSRVSSIRVGDAELRDVTVVVHPFAADPRIGGLLGLNFLKEFHTSVDPQKSRLTLTPR